MDAWTKVIDLGVGGEDPYNKEKITQEEYDAAVNSRFAFYHIAYRKRNKIAKFMYKHYKGIEGVRNPNAYGVNTFLPQNQSFVIGNYNVFLSKYMNKNETTGFYERKPGMWTNKGTSEEPEWVPNKPD